MPEIFVPEQVKNALRRLHENGFEAFAVGGCVRDSLLSQTPLDWDITTSARPTATEHVFQDCRFWETGIQHGTVTVLLDGMPLEITTFRVDGDYCDARHPQSVAFTSDLKEDLLRRDFTVNTLCWSEETGIVDLCGGLSDLQNGILRAVGNPDRRFREDALRILRGIRFAAVLGFQIEEETAQSILRNRPLLLKIAPERIRVEFSKLLCGKNAAEVLKQYREVIAVFIPEVRALFDCPQNTPYHCRDVYRHTLSALENTEPEELLRLCMFFHDFGKPLCRKTDKNGTDHFKGHQKVGAEIVEPILKRLRYDNKTVKTVTNLIAIHDLKAPKTKVEAKLLLSQIGVDSYRALIKIKRADCRGKAQPHAIDEKLAHMEEYFNEILKNNECYTLAQLAVNGEDLKTAGITDGKEIRDTLSRLLETVIREECPNEKAALLSKICETRTL